MCQVYVCARCMCVPESLDTIKDDSCTLTFHRYHHYVWCIANNHVCYDQCYTLFTYLLQYIFDTAAACLIWTSCRGKILIGKEMTHFVASTIGSVTEAINRCLLLSNWLHRMSINHSLLLRLWTDVCSFPTGSIECRSITLNWLCYWGYEQMSSPFLLAP